MAKGWTAERRAAYARRMKARKAWVHSTGPRTDEGKARSSGNAAGNGYLQRLDAELAGVEALMLEWAVVRADLRVRTTCDIDKSEQNEYIPVG